MDKNIKGIFTFVMMTVIMTICAVNSFKSAENVEVFWASQPSVTGVLKHVSYSHGGTTNAHTWTISVKYVYKVKGIEYEGDKLGGIKGSVIETEETIKNKITSNGLKKGNEVKVYYNSKKPDESRLFIDTTTDKQMGIFAIFLALVGVVGTIFFGIKIKNKR